MPKKAAYDESSINVLKGVEAIRAKKEMYVGNDGMNQILWEIIDNAVDEAIEGHGDKITIKLHDDNSISVEDNGRGIPTGLHPTEKVPTIDLVLTEIHAGGKFHTKTYATSGGTHGIGAAATNALSEWLTATIYREGKKWERKYERGIPTTKGAPKAKKGRKGKTGTIITFKPDEEIFKKDKFKPERIAKRLRELSYLLSNVEFIFKYSGKTEKFKSSGGIADFVKELTAEREGVFPSKPVYFKGINGDIHLEFAFQYTDGEKESLKGYANNIYNMDGGVHISGFRNSITRVINAQARDFGLLKEKDGNLSGDEVRAGMVGVISVRVPLPQFEGQTKTKLCNIDVEGIVSTMTLEFMEEFLKKNKTFIKNIVDVALVNRKARDAARRAKEAVKRKSGLSKVVLPGKLVDCRTNSINKSELFIVEGDSAAGPAKQARNSEFQAVMPIRGKSLNVEKASVDKILKNNELNSIISAIGCGIQLGDNPHASGFDMDDLRYGKIIITTDADIDGYHIRTLLLTFFLRYMKPLIENGNIYVSEPPLFCVEHNKKKKYYYSEEELKNAKRPKGSKTKRFKGLGEQNVDELKETCMDPGTRRLTCVKIEDFDNVDNIVNVLMGSDVSQRREFIADNANKYS